MLKFTLKFLMIINYEQKYIIVPVYKIIFSFSVDAKTGRQIRLILAIVSMLIETLL